MVDHPMRHLIQLVESAQTLDEMLLSVNLVGEPQPGSFRADDIALVTTPKAQAKMRRVWHNSVADVDLYLLNTPGDDRHRHQLLYQSFTHAGAISPAVLQRRFGLTITPRRDAIAVVLTNNEGDDRMPLTGWIVAHRMFHIFQEAAARGLGAIAIKAAVRRIHYAWTGLMDMAEESYVADGAMAPNLTRKGIHLGAPFLRAIGTTKAARTGKLTAHNEIVPEAFAQFMLTDDVRFNPPPETLDVEISHWPYGRRVECTLLPERKDALQNEIAIMEHTFVSGFEAIIAAAQGKVFLL
jgi:hypothetical protein